METLTRSKIDQLLAAWSAQCAPIACWPPVQQDALGQHPCFFWQHSGVSDARLPESARIPNGATIMVASKAIAAIFFIAEFPISIEM